MLCPLQTATLAATSGHVRVKVISAAQMRTSTPPRCGSSPPILPLLFPARALQSSNFFINYVMLLAFGAWGAALLRLVPLILVWIKLKWLAKTPREREDAMNPGAFGYAVAYATDLLVCADLHIFDARTWPSRPIPVVLHMFWL